MSNFEREMKNLDTRKLNLSKLKWTQEIGPHIPWEGRSLRDDSRSTTGNYKIYSTVN